jgi:hypothetical protein
MMGNITTAFPIANMIDPMALNQIQLGMIRILLISKAAMGKATRKESPPTIAPSKSLLGSASPPLSASS